MYLRWRIGGGILQSSIIIGRMRRSRSTLATKAESSSSRTHRLVTLKGDNTIIAASAFPIPSSKILRTRLSPGPISHWSTHASIPVLRRAVAKGMTKRRLSSDAWQVNTRGDGISVEITALTGVICSRVKCKIYYDLFESSSHGNGKRSATKPVGHDRSRGQFGGEHAASKAVIIASCGARSAVQRESAAARARAGIVISRPDPST